MLRRLVPVVLSAAVAACVILVVRSVIKDRQVKDLMRHFAAQQAPHGGGVEFKRHGGVLAELRLAPDLSLVRVVSTARMPSDILALVLAQRDLRALGLTGENLSYVQIDAIARMEHLEELGFSRCSLPSDISALEKLNSLGRLTCRNTPLSTAHIASVARMRRVRSLGAVGCHMSDEELAELRPLAPRLQLLELSVNPISANGVAGLGPLPRLTALRLQATHIDDGLAAAISRAGLLSELDIAFTRISDNGLAELAGASLPLKKLVLIGCTEITDNSVLSLSSLTGLQYLRLDGTMISSEGRRAIQNALPGCDVSGVDDP